MTPEQKRKDSCRSFAGVYLRRGKIKRLTCEVCGSDQVIMHHSDYQYPLKITWLCKKHHQKWHVEHKIK